MFPLPVASLTTMESNQRVNSVGLGQVHSASWCRVSHSRLLPTDLDMMSGWDVSSLVMCEMPLSFGHFSDTGVGYFHLCDLGWGGRLLKISTHLNKIFLSFP